MPFLLNFPKWENLIYKFKYVAPNIFRGFSQLNCDNVLNKVHFLFFGVH